MGRQSIELPDSVKEGLDAMSKSLGMTQNALISLAVTTMVAKYEAEGMRIFFDLISLPTSKIRDKSTQFNAYEIGQIKKSKRLEKILKLLR